MSKSGSMVLMPLIRRLQRMDMILAIAVFMLFALGISAIYSVELSREGSGFFLVQKQLIAYALGIVGACALIFTNYFQLKSLGRLIYISGLALMVLVLIFGADIRGTTGWFLLGPFSFQPVEFMKIALAVALARYFSEQARRHFGWREIIGSGAITAIPFFFTMMQPDLGSATLLLGIWLTVMFFAGFRWYHGAVFGVAGVLAVIFGWFFFLQNYQKERLMVFLDPMLDPLGSGYNILQAKIAIGSGRLFGRGLGFGSQSQLKFLPESQTDFIFAVIAEELGFIGVMVLFLAFGLLFWRILVLISRAKDHFTAFLAAGLFGALFVQATVNIGVNLAILPATGVALPFVSYGGSSVLISLLMVGILQSIAVHERPADRVGSVV